MIFCDVVFCDGVVFFMVYGCSWFVGLWLKLWEKHGLAKNFDEKLAFFHQKLSSLPRGTTLVEM